MKHVTALSRLEYARLITAHGWPTDEADIIRVARSIATGNNFRREQTEGGVPVIVCDHHAA